MKTLFWLLQINSQVLAIASKAATNIFIHVVVWTYVLLLLEKIAKTKIACLCGMVAGISAPMTFAPPSSVIYLNLLCNTAKGTWWIKLRLLIDLKIRRWSWIKWMNPV